MKILLGLASRVRHAVHVSGNQHGVGSYRVYELLIDGRPVEISMPDSIRIDEGDTVVVAGAVRKGVLQARAYYNRTNGTYGGWSFGLVQFVVMSVIALACLGFLPPLGLVLGLILVCQFVSMLRTLRARMMVRSSR